MNYFCGFLITIPGSNLWLEYNRGEVFQFLKNLYSSEKLSSQGLSEKNDGVEEHGVAIVPQVEENLDTLESLDMSNYKKVNRTFKLETLFA